MAFGVVAVTAPSVPVINTLPVSLYKPAVPASLLVIDKVVPSVTVKALMVGAARGAAIISAAEYTESLYEYTPMQIKQAVTGYGKADKKQIQQMVKLLLGMKEIPKPDDAADAIACAITHCQCGAAKEQFRMK